MSTATAVLENRKTALPKPRRNGRQPKISLQTFLDEYSQREDGFKYEYEDGVIITSNYTLTDSIQHISNNLRGLFYRLNFQGKVQGNLAAGKDTFLSHTKLCKPDLCYMNPQHDYEAANGGHPKPDFVIEIVSPSDTAEYYDNKLDRYFEAGVKVIWFIYPQSEKVVVYAPDQSSITCRGDMICSALPALTEFSLPAKDVFVKPLKPT